MGSENQNPLDELQVLDRKIDQITELAALKSIFFRVDELAREHPLDFEVQLAVTEVRQKVMLRGTALKQLAQPIQRTAQVPVQVPPPPPLPAAAPPEPAAPSFQAHCPPRPMPRLRLLRNFLLLRHRQAGATRPGNARCC